MGAAYTKIGSTEDIKTHTGENIPAEMLAKLMTGRIPIGEILTYGGKKYTIRKIASELDKPDSKFARLFKFGKAIYYVTPIDVLGGDESVEGGAAIRSKGKPSTRVKAQPVLYPEEGLHSKWSSPRKRTEKISVDGKAPVNFLAENIGE